MEHVKQQELVDMLLDRKLNNMDSAAVFRHLAECAECRHYVRSAWIVRHHIAGASLADAPASLDQRILDGIPGIGSPGKGAVPSDAVRSRRLALSSSIWRSRVSMRIPVLVATLSLLALGSFYFGSRWDPLKISTPQIQTVYITTFPAVEVHGYTP